MNQEKQGRENDMTVDEEVLHAAMVEAVAVGIFPKYLDFDTYVKNWIALVRVVQAALLKLREGGQHEISRT